MGTAEAIGLIRTLPQGSRYVRATDPARAWSEERCHTADVVDALSVVAWALGAYDRDACPEPPRVARPGDADRRRRRAALAAAARRELETDGWREE